MDGALVKAIGIKTLLYGGGALLLLWTFNAIKLVIGARGINPLIKQFFDQIASGRIDGAYRLTTKTYKQHVNRQDFLKFLKELQLNKYKNLKSGRPRIENNQILLTLNLKSEDKSTQLPLEFTFTKVDKDWRINRIARANS
ncbi:MULTISPECIES: membrane protein [Prochlorococcus]|uniref:Predicted membrane protein n=1 Tax=Prochlorococcus marinus (strain SARG / CCMP1375 / SS120) TaxID=167539 RepID=Q7V9J3_PROMA|nr:MULTISPECIES: membrane protein [Prochlorococcus]AAQ00884.1 Predicted membrane protein [Prochlorococcus marinus subsp. marinus str. CCMP1375]KGG10622.1 hypothetical protein EV04_1581 [Prochlorococcus marinus str. LG]KGG19912.1 hypothetical protein EV08_1226 [Prochlorococcus marinus str. SS2]KGG23868.1 hypothetical protein EV09_0470 [Prochlorococcus marinus str. SS35]KGG31872.1 hypothetical protein EV10_1971 [Prochlorococcus marinus str. SS51]